jgi:uncharacterized protein (TIGR03437 family)
MGWHYAARPVAAFQTGTAAIVSAASYEAKVAPDSIAAVFGTNLANSTETGRDTDPGTPGIQLPTTLGGVTVEIGGVRAGLFFISPAQINLHVPPNVPVGSPAIVVRNNGVVSNGTAQIVNVAPGIFTFNATGQGVAAGNAVRIRNNVASFDEIASLSGNQFVTKAIELGPASDQVFLSLYGTGWRRAAAGTIRVVLAGVEYTPQFAGAQPDFVALDQLNLLIPRALLGAGKVNVTLNATGASSANTVEVEVAGAAGGNAPTVTNPTAPVTAADSTTISGNGFSTTPASNLVRIGGIEAQVLSATATSLSLRVPYGAETGAVTVRTAQGEGRSSGALQVRTSVSGVIETTDRQPLNNVAVRALVGLNLFNARTNTSGAFVLSELPAGGNVALVSIDGSSIGTTPSYGSLSLNQNYLNQRDNQFASPVALQQVTGTAGQVGGGGSFNGEDDEEKPLSLSVDIFATAKELPREAWPSEWQNALQPAPDDVVIRVGEVTLSFPANVDATFADGAKRGLVTLTQIENSRTPVNLPSGVFSAAIVQITPFGTSFGNGGKLTFPNPERYPAGTQVNVYRLDQRRNSPTLGRFIVAGIGTVSADGLTIMTAPGVVSETSYYFVGLPRTITNVNGRVLDADRTPLRRALVRLRGQEAFTDGNGGFVLRNVPVANASDSIIVEASFARPNGRVDRANSNRTAPVINGFTNVGDILMPAANSNQPPALVVPSTITANAGQTNDFNLLSYDVDERTVPVVRVTGAPFAAIITAVQTGQPVLRLTPTANQLGSFTLQVTATDSQHTVTTRSIALRVVNPNRAPTANAGRAVTDEDKSVQFTLTGSDPDGTALKYLIVTRPANGVLTGTPPALTFTPNLNFNGTDGFTFRASDGVLDSAPATVTLVVNSINDPPVLSVPAQQNIQVGQTLTFSVTATDPDAGQTVTINAANLPSGASFNVATRQFSWTPNSGQAGTFTVTFTAVDNGTPPQSDAKSVTINVGAGSGWVQTRGPNSVSITSLTPSGSAVLAATPEGLLFRSTNNGGNWSQVLNGGDFTSLVLATTGNTVYAASTTRFYASTDNGAQFNSIAAGYPVGLITGLAADGANVYLGVFTGTGTGLYRSTNGGATWTQMTNGLPNPAFPSVLIANGATVVAGLATGQLYRSTDSGATWSLVQLPVTVTGYDSALAVGATMYVTDNGVVLRSTNGGATWTVLARLDTATIESLSFSGNLLYAATLGNGIFTVAADGTSSSLGTTGLPSLEISAALVSGAGLLASTYINGVYRSTNAGQSWSASNTGIIASVVTALASGNGLLFANILPYTADSLAAVARTSDNGQTWTIATIPQVQSFVSSLAFGNNVLLAGTDGDGLFRSTDNGVNFALAGNSANVGILDVRSLLANGATIFAGTANGIFRSTDSGVTWARVYTAPGPVISLSLVGTTLYAGQALQTGGALLRSTDNGANWAALPASAGLNQAVTSVVASGTTLIASAIQNENTSNGIYVSTNNGTSWTPVTGSANTPFAFKLVTQGTVIYAATGIGVFRSINAGQTWTAFNEGLPNLIAASLLLSGNNLFVGTGGSGVFIRNVGP